MAITDQACDPAYLRLILLTLDPDLQAPAKSSELQQLVSGLLACPCLRLKPGQLLFKFGERSQKAFLVLSGTLKKSMNKEVAVLIEKWSLIVFPQQQLFQVVCQTQCQLIEIAGPSQVYQRLKAIYQAKANSLYQQVLHIALEERFLEGNQVQFRPISRWLTETKHQKGTPLFQQKTVSSWCYFLLEGTVQLSKRFKFKRMQNLQEQKPVFEMKNISVAHLSGPCLLGVQQAVLGKRLQFSAHVISLQSRIVSVPTPVFLQVYSSMLFPIHFLEQSSRALLSTRVNTYRSKANHFQKGLKSEQTKAVEHDHLWGEDPEDKLRAFLRTELSKSRPKSKFKGKEPQVHIDQRTIKRTLLESGIYWQKNKQKVNKQFRLGVSQTTVFLKKIGFEPSRNLDSFVLMPPDIRIMSASASSNRVVSRDSRDSLRQRLSHSRYSSQRKKERAEVQPFRGLLSKDLGKTQKVEHQPARPARTVPLKPTPLQQSKITILNHLTKPITYFKQL